MDTDLEMLAGAANEGDGRALERLILAVQDKIYALAMRMLYHPSDAEDAAQEILLKMITHLGTFRGESSFSTWMYRVAANHLLTMRKRQAERRAVSFKEYEKTLDLETAGHWSESRTDVLDKLFIEEIRISCLQGLLLCLDRDHRLAYLLADVFDCDNKQGATILDITPAAFRKRLSRARKRIEHFLTKNCALVNPDNPCQCERYIKSYLKDGKLDDRDMIFAKHPCRVRLEDNFAVQAQEIKDLKRIALLYKYYPDFRAPSCFIDNVRKLLRSRKYSLLS